MGPLSFLGTMVTKAIEGLACKNMGEYYTCCRKTFVQGVSTRFIQFCNADRERKREQVKSKLRLRIIY